VGQPFGIRGFPTLKFFGADKREPINFNGQRDLDALMKFAQDTSAVEKEKVESTKPLTENEIEEVMKSSPRP